jgi:iron complex transport system substrate-binding protein
MKNKIIPFAVSTALILLTGVAMYNGPLCAGEYKTINDMCNRKVDVPVNPERIACLHCVSPEKIMTLGKGDLISFMAEQSPWAYRLFPEIRNARTTKNVTPEQLLDMKIDFVLYTPGMTKEEPYSAAGLKTVCSFSDKTRPMNLDEYMENFKAEVSLFGDLLGPEAKTRADRYNAYFDRKVNQILSVTSKIDRKDRPSVYYGGLRRSILNSQGVGSVMHWNVEVAGGNYLPQALDDNHAAATIGQVLAWEPDIIFLSGLCNSTDIVKKDPQWASLKAVKNSKVYHIPQGIYAWDHASNEGVLLMIYMAKIFHPELFKNWDMIKEMKAFYSEIYGRTITDQDAERILQHLPPL